MNALRIGVAVAALLLLGGCADTTETPADLDDAPGWDDELSELRAGATTDLELLILEDGRITDEELAAAEDAFRSCAAGAGFEVTELQPGGGYTIDGPFTEDGPPALTACEASFNRTSGQYWLMERNPAGIDEAELMVDCLVRAGVLDADITRSEYLEALGTPPLTPGAPEFARCNAEPATAYVE
ncbi:hypothetical protein ROT00_07090 [Agromyces mediolanus]|uniref:hypothetical protein n=1 Tax=Agromyces mediolanus TaxID=41986 RepID=UPI00383745CC